MRIDILAMDGLWLASEGWRLSREEWVHYPWDEVYTTDCPVIEMPSCVLHLHEITMIEREILASHRGHVMWARTSVENPIEFIVPDEVKDIVNIDVHKERRAEMTEMRDAGLHRDEWRRLLPMSAVTSVVMRISFRDLMKYVMYFDYLSTKVHANCKPLMIRMRDNLMTIVDKFTGTRDRSIKAFTSIKLAKLLHEKEIFPAKMIETDSFYIANFTVPMWIRAHMVRHRPLSIADDFYQLLLRSYVLDLPINTPIQMEIAATKSFWDTIISKRTCWLLQTTLSAEKDPWQSVIDSFGTFQQDVLPCRDGHCPFEADAHLRVTDYDPSVPCPIYMNFKGIDKTPYMDELRTAAKGRSPFWMDIIEGRKLEDMFLK